MGSNNEVIFWACWYEFSAPIWAGVNELNIGQRLSHASTSIVSSIEHQRTTVNSYWVCPSNAVEFLRDFQP